MTSALPVAAAIAAFVASSTLGPAAAAPAASPAAAAPPVIADDLAPPLSGWQRKGSLTLRTARTGDGKALRISGSGRVVRSLVRDPGALSLDVKLPRGSALAIGLGAGKLTLRQSGKRLAVRAGSFSASVAPHSGWGERWHIELAASSSRSLSIQGRPLNAPLALKGPLTLHAAKGAPEVAGLVVTQRGDRGGLLLHRLAELHNRVALGDFPFGSGSPRGELHLSDDWTSGFWPGSLWRAWDRTGHSGLFRGWALAATLKHFGKERKQIHDQGFLYLESSAAAYDRICTSSRAKASRTCRRLRASALTAAKTLVSLQRGNAAGTIPTLPAKTKCRMCRSKAEAETIIDSMMNVSLYDWAYRQTGDATWRRLALKHSRAVAKLLVRSDGSTFQAVRVRRSDGKLLGHETHQGLSANSTWSRGQGWAVYGFAYNGAAYRDPGLIGVSERAAGYVADHLPASGVPPYDYAAGRGAPIDTSAGVITAAGLFRLADACAQLPAACKQADRWRPLAERMLAASLKHVRSSAPLGYLAGEVFSRGGHARWDDEGDFIFGTAYGLEAVASEGSP